MAQSGFISYLCNLLWLGVGLWGGVGVQQPSCDLGQPHSTPPAWYLPSTLPSHHYSCYCWCFSLRHQQGHHAAGMVLFQIGISPHYRCVYSRPNVGKLIHPWCNSSGVKICSWAATMCWVCEGVETMVAWASVQQFHVGWSPWHTPGADCLYWPWTPLAASTSSLLSDLLMLVSRYHCYILWVFSELAYLLCVCKW